MSTSLLFQHLQHLGHPALQQLQGLLCTHRPTGDVAQCHGSNTDCCSYGGSSYPRSSMRRPPHEVCICNKPGIPYSGISNCTASGVWCSRSCSSGATVENGAPDMLSHSCSTSCSSHAECLVHRILSVSTPLVPPPPPYSFDTNGMLRSARSSSPDPCFSSCSSSSGKLAAAASEKDLPSSSLGISSIDAVALASAAFFPSILPVLRGLWKASDTSDWLLSLEGLSPPHRMVALEVWKLCPSAELSIQLRQWGNSALARGRPAAAASLYTAATLLLPSNNSSSTPNSSSLLAVLSANASLALLRLRRVKRALRTATEAVAADPMYRKAWHRRAAVLVHLREGVERYFLAPGNSNSSTSNPSSRRGISTSYNSDSRAAVVRACLQQIDTEIKEAQRMSQEQVNISEAAASASRMKVGCCGCGCNATPRPLSEDVNHSPGVWLRKDVGAQLGAKGWCLVTANDAVSTLEDDPSLVLEEEAFAVYVHPDLCAPLPKIPLPLLSHHKFQTAQNPEGLRLYSDATVRDAWEVRVEEGAVHKKEGKGNDEKEGAEQEVYRQEETEGICAGCATVPARAEGTANEFDLQEFEAWHSQLSHLLYPTLPVVPCGSCTAALFCCHGCRAASSHKRVCRLQQQQELREQEACGMEVGAGRRDISRGTREANAKTAADNLMQPLALALPDPHRCIARQLLASLLLPGVALDEPAEDSGLTTFVKSPNQQVELSDVHNSAGSSTLGEPPWRQLLMRASSVVVDSTRVADWLLNAAWLAGDAAASGRGLRCGGRCLICRPAGRGTSTPSHSTFATAATAGACLSQRLDEISAKHLRGCCCLCCRSWCPKCSDRSLVVQDSDGLSPCGVPFPRCLFSAALHVYGVACCNSFTIRVLCDPEEEAVAAGTAVFLAASLLNHSCAPNAIAVFGEPKVQLQQQHQQYPKPLFQHKRDAHGGSAAAQPAHFLPSPRGVGRGALLQVRLCAPQHSGDNSRLEELCISYGPLVGLPKSSWGFRQDWLFRHAGFFCRCEACLPQRRGNSAAGAGNVAFGYELLCCFPCPFCTSVSRARELLGGMQQTTGSKQVYHALSDTAELMRRCLGPHLHENCFPTVRQHNLLAEQAIGCSVFSKLSAETLEFVTAFSKLLLPVLAKGQGGQQWISTQMLALLGHSCAPLWSAHIEAFPDASASVSSFLGKNIPVYAFSKLICLNCKLQFPASALERNQEAILVQLERKRDALKSLVIPSSKITRAQRGSLLAEVLKDILQAIPQVVAVSGCLSADVWKVLQSAARAAHAQAEVVRQVHTDFTSSCKPLGMAATCLLAGIFVLLQRLPLGLSQPEVCADVYRAAVLLGQVGDRTHAKYVLRAALKAAVRSCGPHSVSQSSLKEYLRWLERGE